MTSASAQETDLFIARFNSAGAHPWSKRFGDTYYDYATCVAAGSAGQLVVTGHFWGTINVGGTPLTADPTSSSFVVQFDLAGNHVWSKIAGPYADRRGIVVDPVTNATVIVNDAGMQKFDASGDSIWSVSEDSAVFRRWRLRIPVLSMRRAISPALSTMIPSPPRPDRERTCYRAAPPDLRAR